MCFASRSKFVACSVQAIVVLYGLCCVSGCGELSSSEATKVEHEIPIEPPYVARPAGTLTYCRDIAPVIIENCAPCHRPGEAAPLSLLSYADVIKRGQQLVEVTSDRYMPPWLPQHGYGNFAGERRLTNDEIGMLAQWIEEGAVEGDQQVLPPMPDWPEGWQLGEPDLVVTMTEPFELPADGGDVFRNFVIPVKIPATRYVEAVEFRPGNQKILHHATIRVDATHSSRRLDENDPQPGFGGMQSSSNAHFPNGQFLGWTAGKVPHRNEPGLSWPLERGTDLVLELHLQPTGKPESLQSSIGLFFWYRKGVSLAKLGNSSEALKCVQRAIELDPNDVRFYNNLGVLLQQVGNIDAAKSCLLRALQIRPATKMFCAIWG